ncbi:MAG TPA: hypothetical protein DCO79_00740 [Spirochaeta sp.]|nr:hypothetical protein [Spirochaeta sp.]
MKKIRTLFTLILLTTLTVFASAQIEQPPVEINAEIVDGPNSSYLLRVEYAFPEGYHQTLQEDFFKFEITSPEGLNSGPITYPEGTIEGDLINYYGSVTIEAELLSPPPESTETITVKASWQVCDEEGTCLFPQSTEFTVSANFTNAGAGASEASGGIAQILIILLFAFLGGLLLNVMPCVLPVLSIKALSLVKQGGEDRKQILLSSLLYTAGVIISLLALALVIIIIKASGEQVGWGFQFQNRGFVIALLTIIFVFALSLFEVFTISAPVLKTGSAVNRSGSAGSHFFSGVIAVLLATPCTAPFLGTAAGFAFSQSAFVILAVFFMVGLGLSFPFILIGFMPSIVSKLPKPGAWMNTFREIMGFLLIGTSVWLIDVLIYQSAAGFLTKILIYLTAVTLAAWLYGKMSQPSASKRKRIIGSSVAVLIIAVSAIFLFSGNNDAVENETASPGNGQFADWLDFSPETVYENIGGDVPVFVAFGAKWCMTCRTNESTVIFTNEISRFFEENNVILIHGDYTNENPEITEWMNEYGRAGVPFYSWYPAGSFEAVLLPEIINRKSITSLIE